MLYPGIWPVNRSNKTAYLYFNPLKMMFFKPMITLIPFYHQHSCSQQNGRYVSNYYNLTCLPPKWKPEHCLFTASCSFQPNSTAKGTSFSIPYALSPSVAAYGANTARFLVFALSWEAAASQTKPHANPGPALQVDPHSLIPARSPRSQCLCSAQQPTSHPSRFFTVRPLCTITEGQPTWLPHWTASFSISSLHGLLKKDPGPHKLFAPLITESLMLCCS